MQKQILFALLGLSHLAEADEVWHKQVEWGELSTPSKFRYSVSTLDSYVEEDENDVPQLW